MACQFSEGWSGTPMWQLAQGREETMRKEREAREAQAGDVLEIDSEAAGFRSVLYVSKMVGDKYEDSKVRGPRRKTRAQAIKDGLSLRNACRDAPKDAKLEAAQRRSVELRFTFWKPEELPKEDFDFEEPIEKPMRLRLARKPRGNGWQRVGDKEFFRHCSAPMAFDPVKGRYLKIDADTNSYVDCDVPHDPIEYSVSTSVGASLVGQTDEDLNAADRPRSMILKELVKTGAAMKTPLFFLDQPAACFAMFDGVRGGAAVEWCSKHFHTKLLPQLSASITYWHDADLRGLLRSILAELDVQLVQQAGCCWEGVSIAVALLLGDRLVVASLGGTHALVASPDGRWRSLDGRHVASSAEEQLRSKALGAEIIGEEKGKGVVGAPFVRKAERSRDWQVIDDATAEEEVGRVLDRTSDCFATLGLGPEDKIDGKAARSCYKKLALKVHPDKAPDELKARAKAAFEKVEKAAAVVEAFCETDMEATECLRSILHAAGSSGASMSRATALGVLNVPEDCSLEEAGRQGRELRETIMKLGMLTDGNYGHPDQAAAVRMIEEAAEAIAEPATLTASKGGSSFSSLKPVQVTRALGLRDLKLPRKVVSSEPQIDVVQLETLGSHHLVLLSSGATSLSDQEVIERIRGFSGQPKAASLLVAADAAAKNAARDPCELNLRRRSVTGVGVVNEDGPGSEAKDGSTGPFAVQGSGAEALDWAASDEQHWVLWMSICVSAHGFGDRNADVVAWMESAKLGVRVAASHWEDFCLHRDIPQEWSSTREAAVESANSVAEERWPDWAQRLEELASIASEVARTGQAIAVKEKDTSLHRMATQLGFYWWHVSNADASQAVRCLSSAAQSFHESHWSFPAWRGVNLGGLLLLEPGPASPFFDVCQAKILEISGGPLQEHENVVASGTRENPPGLGDEYSVCAALQAAGGDQLRSELFQRHRLQHYTEKTFADIAETGLNAIRIPFGHWVVQGPGDGEPYEGPCLEILDGCVQMAEAQGLQVLLDLHGNPGGESGSRPCGRESSLWTWEDWRQDEAVEVLRLLAARYGDKSCVTGIQVCNEPSENIPVDRLCDFYERAIEAVRSSGMGPDKVAIVLPIFTHWRLKQMMSCWHSRGNCLRFDNVAFDIHYYHDFSAIWKLLPHYRHVEVVAEHARELKLLPGSVVGEWSLSRPGHFSDEEKADFANKQVAAYNHSTHGWFFWNWHDHAFYPDWDLESGVFGTGKLRCPLGPEELKARARHTVADFVATSYGMGKQAEGVLWFIVAVERRRREDARKSLVLVLNAGLLELVFARSVARLIISCGLRVNDCIEKSDLIDRAREAIAKKAHGGCLQQNWTNGRAPKLDAKSTQPPSHKSGKHIKSFKKRTPASGNSRNSGLKLSLLPQSQAQATAAPTQVLRRLIRHFGWSSDAFVDKTALLQRALQALAQPKALPKPHRIQHQGHAAHVLTPKLLKKTAGSLPLLFVLHGAGRTKASVESSVLQFSKMSSRNKILIAIPMSIDRTWDLRQTATTGQASADAAFISYILDCLNRDYYIDSGRIAVMGFSDGGSYAISLAVNNPEVFQAAMSWSAGYYLESRHSGQAAPTRSKPNILHGHGQVDELFDFQKVAVPMRQSLRSSGHLVTPHNVRSAGAAVHGVPCQAERELMRLKAGHALLLSMEGDGRFPAMARKHSECKSALQPGQMAGDLGWISKGSLGDPTLEDVVLALEVNELSDLVTTARGVHLVQRYA
ncbi:exgA [Symbiodinium natans]|uniref:glucan 1,3-beta-glucosidase n=1 Tax=Symbiodinium natans TaxID=878477 RepID=A0A812T2V3_9DINO|nr:exgA [Symbiodinium natans]